MKKLGYFLLSFVPLLLAVVMQIAATIFMMLLSLLFSLLKWGSFAGSFTKIIALYSDTEFNGCIMVIYCLIALCVFGIWYYRSLGGEYLPDLRTTFHPLQFVGILLLVPGVQFFTSYLIGIISVIFPSWLEAYMKLMETAGLEGSVGPMMLFYAVLIGPVAEELIFRGMTLRSFRRVFPFWLANLCQAALFGFYHMNLLQGVYAAALGLILGYICERGGSIYLSIFLHILYNFWGTVVTEAIDGLSLSDELLSVIMLIGMIISLAIGGVVFHIGQKKKAATVKRLQSQESLPSSL